MIGLLYRALLVAYPRDFRARFADELHLAFVEGLRAARQRGVRQAFVFASTRLADALSSGLGERMARSRARAATPPINLPCGPLRRAA